MGLHPCGTPTLPGCANPHLAGVVKPGVWASVSTLDTTSKMQKCLYLHVSLDSG